MIPTKHRRRRLAVSRTSDRAEADHVPAPRQQGAYVFEEEQQPAMAHQASPTALKRKCPEPEDEEMAGICANNGCGFFSAAATGNMCSKCYKEHVAAAASDTTTADNVSIIAPPALSASPEKKAKTIASVASTDGVAETSVTALKPPMAATNRCATCSKKVGLLGFRYRCEGTFCTVHRYSDKHHCGFDYKTAGREQIAKHNPVVVADKIATRI